MRALIFGITGQDGSLLAHLLLSKGYKVFGVSRNYSNANNRNLELLGIESDIQVLSVNTLNLEEVKLVIQNVRPSEIYNLGGQTSVSDSFRNPHETFKSIFQISLNILESIKEIDTEIKFLNPSSIECFGSTKQKRVLTENSKFYPLSPYAMAKYCTHNLAKNYRKNYGIYVSTAILSNHESILRGPNFVTKKIIDSAYQISIGKQNVLEIGDASIVRDWGCAEEFVEAMYLMLQLDAPTDLIIATGKSISLDTFVNYVFQKFKLDPSKFVKINKMFVRTNENKQVYVNPARANNILNWKAKSDVFAVIDKIILKYI